MPRYSARASVCERATWAATSVTTVCFSLRLRLKSSLLPSRAPAAIGFGRFGSATFRTGTSIPLRRDRHLRWPLSSPEGAAPAVFDDLRHPVSRAATAHHLVGGRRLRRPNVNFDQAACAGAGR